MEALQMLKFSLKRDALNFTGHLATSEADMLDDVDDVRDLLADVLSDGNGKAMDILLAAMGKNDEVEDKSS